MANVLPKLLKAFPFCEIKTVEVEGQQMTFFPKTYVRREGNGGAGTRWLFSDKPKDGYHLHHSFYKFNSAGEEVENGVLHSRYIASQASDNKPASSGAAIWGNIPYTDINAKAKLRGEDWGALNIYDYHFRGMLMLMEALAMGYTGADIQTAIGGTDGSMGVTHFDITNIWGGTDKGFWIYGLDTVSKASVSNMEHNISNTNIHVLGKFGQMVDTGIAPPGNGYPVTFQTKSATAYDLSDLLLAATVDGSQANGSCGDYQDLGSSGGRAFYSGWSTGDTAFGPWFLSYASPGVTGTGLGFALRKAA